VSARTPSPFQGEGRGEGDIPRFSRTFTPALTLRLRGEKSRADTSVRPYQKKTTDAAAATEMTAKLTMAHRRTDIPV